MILVRRNGWGARVADHASPIPTPTPRLWVHHTGTEQHGAQGVRDIQAYHMDVKGWSDIAYSFLIDDDGTIYEGRGAGVAGAHTQGDNSSSHAICLMGNFDNRMVTTAALNSIIELAHHGKVNGWWKPTLGGHRDAPGASTACPGHNLYQQLPRIRFNVDNYNVQEDDFNMDKNTLIAMFNDGEPIAERIQRQAGQAIAHQALTEGSQLRAGIRQSVLVCLDDLADDPNSPLRRAIRAELEAQS